MLLFSLVQSGATSPAAIFAPCSEVPGLMETVDRLRGEGETVICALPGQAGTAADMGCDRELILEGGQWKVKKI